MTAKEYLMQAFRAKKKIASLREDIQRLENAATDCSANLSGMPHNPSPTQSRMADIVCKMVDRKAELEKALLDLEAIVVEISYKICLIDNNDYRNILHMRYIDGFEWVDISDKLSYSLSWTYRLHTQAIAEFKKINKDNS